MIIRVLLLSLVLGFAPLAQSATDAEALLARVRDATGGARWNEVQQLSHDSTLAVGGLEGTLQTVESLRDGRSKTTFDLGVIAGAQGDDGTAAWRADATGLIDIDDSEPARQKARTERFLASREYLRLPLDLWQWDLNTVQEDGQTFQVLGLRPTGGDNVELWIDEQNLIARVVRPVEEETATWSDYRPVDGLRLPHRIVTKGQNESTETILTYRMSRRIDAAALARPRSQASDVRMDGRRAAIPAFVEGGHIFVRARLGDNAPRIFVLDTGAGANVLTPEVVKELAIESQGNVNARGVGEQQVAVSLTRIPALHVGTATLTQQSFAVIPIPFTPIEADGQRELPVGVLGYDFFRRFVVTLDYADERVTLAPLSQSCREPGRDAVRLFLDQDRTPEVRASLDGVEALWTVDVGASGALVVARPIAQRLGIAADAGALYVGVGGVGGATRERKLEFGRFEIGRFRIDRPLAGISQQTAGAFADRGFGGNIGYETLRRFKPTFDYECRVMKLEPSRHFASPEEHDRAGVLWTLREGHRVAVHVVPGSPAANAGLAKDDEMLAIDDRVAADVSGDRVSELQSAAPGSVVRYRIRRDEETRDVTVTLADFIPRASSATH